MKVAGFQRLLGWFGASLSVADVRGLPVFRAATAAGPAVTSHPGAFGRDPAANLRASWRRQRGAIGLAGLGLFLGLFVVAQWQSQVDTPATAGSRPALTLDTIQRLEAEQATLKQQISQLRADNAARQQQASRSASAIAQIDNEVAVQRAIAGTVPLRGPGIQILLDDSRSHTLLPSESADDYIVHEYQIRDIVNLLWGAGATGIAVNGERFVNSTSVYCVGSTILINDTRTSPPYEIVAVGDVGRMRAALDDGNALRDLKDRVQAYGLVLTFDKTGNFTLPAFDGSISMRQVALNSGSAP